MTNGEFRCSLILSLVSIFITMQPEILQGNLKFLICRKVEDTYYSLADPYVKCDEDYYNNVVLPINLSVFLIFGVLIPVYLTLNLYRKHKAHKLRTIENLRIYGFFYNELNKNCFYWDFILMGTKIIMAIVSTVYYETEGMKLCIIMFMVFSLLVFSEKKKPYIKHEMTKLLTYSLSILL